MPRSIRSAPTVTNDRRRVFARRRAGEERRARHEGDAGSTALASSASRRRPRAARPRRTCRRPASASGTPGPVMCAPQRRLHRVALRRVAARGSSARGASRKPADDLVDDALVEARRVQVGRLLGLDQLGEHRVRARRRSRGAAPARAPSRSCRGRRPSRQCAAIGGAAAARRTRGRRTGCPRRSARRRSRGAARARRGGLAIERPLGFWKLGSA